MNRFYKSVRSWYKFTFFTASVQYSHIFAVNTFGQNIYFCTFSQKNAQTDWGATDADAPEDAGERLPEVRGLLVLERRAFVDVVQHIFERLHTTMNVNVQPCDTWTT